MNTITALSDPAATGTVGIQPLAETSAVSVGGSPIATAGTPLAEISLSPLAKALWALRVRVEEASVRKTNEGIHFELSLSEDLADIGVIGTVDHRTGRTELRLTVGTSDGGTSREGASSTRTSLRVSPPPGGAGVSGHGRAEHPPQSIEALGQGVANRLQNISPRHALEVVFEDEAARQLLSRNDGHLGQTLASLAQLLLTGGAAEGSRLTAPTENLPQIEGAFSLGRVAQLKVSATGFALGTNNGNRFSALA